VPSTAQVLIIGAVVFADTFGSLIIFPFMPFMVQDFFPSTPVEQLGEKFFFTALHKVTTAHSGFLTGLYVGILASAFHVGGLLASVMVRALISTFGVLCLCLSGSPAWIQSLPSRALLTLPQWGKLADIFGRRPIMLCGLAGTLLSITMFGFR
jgi:MFS family permease